MKTENKEPILSNGWLIPGNRCIYGNTPYIQIVNVKSITFYTIEDDTKSCIIKFDDIKWHYENKDDLDDDYITIINMLAETNNTKTKQKKYI